MRISDWSSDVCSSDLQQQQQALTRYLRDPDHCPIPPGMDVARAQVYRDLIFENLRGLLSGTFPVLVNVLGQDRKSVVSGQSVSVRVDFGGCRIIKKKHNKR